MTIAARCQARTKPGTSWRGATHHAEPASPKPGSATAASPVGERVTAAELAEGLEVSPCTACRDAEAMPSAGVPVYTERGRGGGIRLLPGC